MRPQEGVWDLGALEGPRWYQYLPLMNGEPTPPGSIFSSSFEDGQLIGWTPNNGIWFNPTGENAVGYYALGNAWNIQEATGVNFAYEGSVILVDGNAVGLTFRSSTDGLSSYDVILDAVDGVFKISRRPPYQVLDSYAMTVERGRPYRIRIEADGNMIHAFLDGAPLLSVTDSTYGNGHFGVIVFRALAVFDDLVAWQVP